MDEKKNLSSTDVGVTDELQAALEAYRSSKSPKGVTEGRKKEWAELIGSAFQDRSKSFEVLRPYLELLPPSITAGGIARVWPAISKDRRSEYLRWLASLDAERAAGQKAVLIPTLLSTSPEAAVQILSDLRLSKELRDRLATSIFDSRDHVEIFFADEVPRYKFPELLSRLLILFESPKASLEAKIQLIRLVVEQIVSRNLQTGSEGIGILRMLEPRLASLPMTAQNELQSFLAILDPVLCERLFPPRTVVKGADVPRENGPAADAQTGKPDEISPAPETCSVAARNTLISVPTTPGPSLEPSPISRLTEWFEWFSRPAQIFDELRKDIKSLEETRAQLVEALTRAHAENEKAANDAAEHRKKIRDLEDRLSSSMAAEIAAQQQSESLQIELSKQLSMIAELRADLERQTAEALERQTELSQRIQKNAEGRLEEYRTRLASAFSRLFAGVPARGAPVSADDCQALLTRFYEIADFLDQEGIRVIPG